MGAHLGYSTRKPPIDQYGDGRKNSICTYIHTRKNARTHATHIPTISIAKLIYRTLLLKRSTQPDPSIGKRIRTLSAHAPQPPPTVVVTVRSLARQHDWLSPVALIVSYIYKKCGELPVRIGKTLTFFKKLRKNAGLWNFFTQPIEIHCVPLTHNVFPMGWMDRRTTMYPYGSMVIQNVVSSVATRGRSSKLQI